MSESGWVRSQFPTTAEVGMATHADDEAILRTLNEQFMEAFRSRCPRADRARASLRTSGLAETRALARASGS
jgi:hypothetical protein